MKSSGRREGKTPSSKLQATSHKRQAAKLLLKEATSVKPKIQAASGKRQAPSSKRQATSRERQAPEYLYPRINNTHQVSCH